MPNASADARRITILIVTYNSGEDLHACLETAKAAAPRSALEFLAWDNCSSDDSLAILNAAGIDTFASRENVGFARAVNALADRVTTPYLFLLNPDARPHVGAIDTLVDEAEERPGQSVFCGRNVFADGTVNHTSAWTSLTPYGALMFATGLAGKFRDSPRLNPEAMPDWDRLSDRDVDVATGCALLIRTNTWRALGGFDERYWLYGEEAELQSRLVRGGFGRARAVSGAIFEHDQTSRPNPKQTEQLETRQFAAMLRGRATLMRNDWPWPQRLLAGPLLRLTAARYFLQSVSRGSTANRSRRLWKMRKDWMQGYPDPKQASGQVSVAGRLYRMVTGLLDPRSYLHAFRILNFYNNTHVKPRRQIELGQAVEISPNVAFFNGARISIGSGCVLAARATLMAGGIHGSIKIGENCLVGPDVLITAANYRGDPENGHRQSGMIERDVVIGNNVWIGAGAVILPGVTVGDGVIIGAGAVVRSSIEAGTVFK